MAYQAAMAALSRGVLGRRADKRNSKTDRRPRKDKRRGATAELPRIHIGPPGAGVLPRPSRTGTRPSRTGTRPVNTKQDDRRRQDSLNRILSIAAAQARAGRAGRLNV